MKKTIALALSAATICSVMLASGCGRNRPTGNNSDGRPGSTASQTDNGSIMPDGSDGNTVPDGSGPPENSTSPPKDPATVKPSAPIQKTTTYAQKAPEKEQKAAVSVPNIKDAKRLFLRVPDAHCEEFFKAQNLLEILEGDFPAFFFYANEKRYETTPLGVSLTPYLLEQLYALLGRENVILK